MGIFLPEGLGEQHVLVLLLLRGALLAFGGLFIILHLFLLGGGEGLIGDEVFGIKVDVFAGLVEDVGLVLGECSFEGLLGGRGGLRRGGGGGVNIGSNLNIHGDTKQSKYYTSEFKIKNNPDCRFMLLANTNYYLYHHPASPHICIQPHLLYFVNLFVPFWNLFGFGRDEGISSFLGWEVLPEVRFEADTRLKTIWEGVGVDTFWRLVMINIINRDIILR